MCFNDNQGGKCKQLWATRHVRQFYSFFFVLFHFSKVLQTTSRTRSVVHKNVSVHANSVHQNVLLAMCTASAAAMKIISAKHRCFTTKCSARNNGNVWLTTFPDTRPPPLHSFKNVLSRISLKSAPNWEAALLKPSSSRPQPIFKLFARSRSYRTNIYDWFAAKNCDSMQGYYSNENQCGNGGFFFIPMFLLLILCSWFM